MHSRHSPSPCSADFDRRPGGCARDPHGDGIHTPHTHYVSGGHGTKIKNQRRHGGGTDVQ